MNRGDRIMSRSKEDPRKTIIENHRTASWANIHKTKPISKVPIPNKIEIENSKEWVDTNEK